MHFMLVTRRNFKQLLSFINSIKPLKEHPERSSHLRETFSQWYGVSQKKTSLTFKKYIISNSFLSTGDRLAAFLNHRINESLYLY